MDGPLQIPGPLRPVPIYCRTPMDISPANFLVAQGNRTQTSPEPPEKVKVKDPSSRRPSPVQHAPPPSHAQPPLPLLAPAVFQSLPFSELGGGCGGKRGAHPLLFGVPQALDKDVVSAMDGKRPPPPQPQPGVPTITPVRGPDPRSVALYQALLRQHPAYHRLLETFLLPPLPPLLCHPAAALCEPSPFGVFCPAPSPLGPPPSSSAPTPLGPAALPSRPVSSGGHVPSADKLQQQQQSDLEERKRLSSRLLQHAAAKCDSSLLLRHHHHHHHHHRDPLSEHHQRSQHEHHHHHEPQPASSSSSSSSASVPTDDEDKVRPPGSRSGSGSRPSGGGLVSAEDLVSSITAVSDPYQQYGYGRKLFPCPQCRYTTDRRNNLKRHMLTMHQLSAKLLECCGVLFHTKAALREHALVFHYHGYTCFYCGRRFCRKALLKRHLSVHNGQKEFLCNVCDYATSHKSNLERHRRVHMRQDDDMSGTDEAPSQGHGEITSCHASEDDEISVCSHDDDEINVHSD